LHLLYVEARGNSRAARRLYGERFPEGVLPFRCTFVELHLRLCETGMVFMFNDGVARQQDPHHFCIYWANNNTSDGIVASHIGTQTGFLPYIGFRIPLKAQSTFIS
jgi:hypothetical protein